ncbi:hypothetical protein VF21_01574 [Pseudogymnoascus sp. 05NY08]|nr:hypothetical protein VF21_01574 [Pseudogymnoascus sp. 05NY08]
MMIVLKRRFNSEQTSEEVFDSETGDCTIEYYNACKDPYRVAPSNKIPVTWPWIVKKASDAGNMIFDHLEESIRKILISHEITAHNIGTHNFASRNTPEKAKDTIFIRTHDESNKSWKMAASEIYDIIEPVAASSRIQMRVEICNEEKMYRDISHFIKDDAMIDTISQIQPFVLDAVMEYCSGKWTSIAYHARGSPLYNSEKKATAIIFIKPGTRHAWSDFEDKIASVIQSATFPGETTISVEVLPGRISPAHPSERPLDYRRLSTLPMVPSNGSSIAPALCTDAVGTLGPVVNYRAAGKEEVKRCFLTCYHVIAPGDPAGKERNDMNGIGINGREVIAQIDIDYPAKCDSEETRRIKMARIEREEGRQLDVDIIERLDKIAAQGPIGRVNFASGYRLLANRRRMDWALVELDPTLPVQNLLPMEAQFSKECLHGVPDYIVQEGDTVSGINTIVKDTWYGKVGRTSDCTGAEFNVIQRVIEWDNGLVSDEYEFRTLHSGEEFAKGGDSGSLVFNLEKEWVGMLFAADPSTKCGFVTPVYELIKDIEETTGGTITLA